MAGRSSLVTGYATIPAGQLIMFVGFPRRDVQITSTFLSCIAQDLLTMISECFLHLQAKEWMVASPHEQLSNHSVRSFSLIAWCDHTESFGGSKFGHLNFVFSSAGDKGSKIRLLWIFGYLEFGWKEFHCITSKHKTHKDRPLMHQLLCLRTVIVYQEIWLPCRDIIIS